VEEEAKDTDEEIAEQPVVRRRRATPPLEEEDEEPLEGELEEEEPRRRPRRRRRRRSRSVSGSAVAGPAIALMIIGALALCYAVLNVGVALIAPAPAKQQARPGDWFGNVDENDTAYKAGKIAAYVLSFCWSGIVLSGAIYMWNLKGYGYAKTGAIVAMVPCSPCCLLGLPFGIWAVIALNKPEVQDAFT
jgi:hypothetical protein